MKYFIFSNIHAWYYKFKKALEEKQFDIDNPEHKIVVCGDLFDKGPNAKQMQSFIMQLLKKDKIIIVKGIHEDIALDMLKHYNKYAENIKESFYWTQGTFQTFLEFTDTTESEAISDLFKFIDKAKQTDYAKNILANSKDYYETDNYIFVYSWIPLKSKPRRFDENWRNATTKAWKLARYYGGPIRYLVNGLYPKDKIIVLNDGSYDFYCKQGEEFLYSKTLTNDVLSKIIPLDARTSELEIAPCIIIED